MAALTIAAGQLATGLTLDAAPPKVRFPEVGVVLAQAHAVGDASYLLLLGSSRFLRIDVGTVTEVLRAKMGDAHPPVVTGAVRAGDAVVALYLLEQLLAKGSRPAMIALEISPETLARPAPWVAEQAIRLFTWSDVAAWAPEILMGDRASRVAAARLAPVHTYRRELLTWLVGSPPPYLRVPRRPRAKPSPQPAKPPAGPQAAPPPNVAPKAAKDGPSGWTLIGLRQPRRWLRHYRPDGGEARCLERLLAHCHERGIPVVLVGMPVTSWVRDLYTPEVERAFGNVIDRVSRSYGTEFVDYRGRVTDDLFKDHHHLTQRGGALFSRTLADEVLVPGLQHAGQGSTSNH